MAAIFTPRQGYVAVLTDGDVPVDIYPEPLDIWGGFDSVRSIVTRLTMNFTENHQVLHSLNRLVFIYTFGSRVGEAVLSGLSFARRCGTESGSSDTHGIEKVYDFYKANRITARSSHIVVRLGATTQFKGFLTGMSLDVLDPKIDLYQWSLRFIVLS